MTVEEWRRKNPPIQRKPITNADYIRSMSDKELAEYLHRRNCPEQKAWKICYEGKDPTLEECLQCWLDWLKQECSDVQL